MERYEVRTYLSKEELPREKQLAWKLAEMACDPVPLEAAVSEMITNRVIDNAAVAVASLNRASVKTARAMAFQHPKIGGASLLGLPAENRFSPEWAAWANGVAVRELDFHDTFLAADYSHPADNIPPLIAVAESLKVSGAALLKGIAAAYEAQVALVKGICLHRHAIDHIAHLGPSVACGLGAMLRLPVEVVYQAIQQALHVTISTRQSRKGEISSWKAFAPAHAGKLAIEAVDRCMRGEGAPSPIYEGEDGVIAYVLAGRELGRAARYLVELPASGEPKRAILQTYTKAHSAEYQAQALIDLAFELRQTLIEKYGSANSSAWPLEKIVISTSHHTHKVIGTGSGDPQKFNPDASRETLDHSLMYIFAVALEDGEWHHEKSYAKARAARPETIALWRKISTKEEARWTQLYHSSDPKEKAFGGQVSLYFNNGEVLHKERSVANAHPNASVNVSAKAGEGDKPPFGRADYVKKFHSLTENFLEPVQRAAFIEKAFHLAELKGVEIPLLNLTLKPGLLQMSSKKGIF